MSNKEMVNHPSHYQSDCGIEVIDVIEGYNLGFNLGNTIKYILRAGHKDDIVQDLNKARWYLDREIGSLLKSKQQSDVNINKDCNLLERLNKAEKILSKVAGPLYDHGCHKQENMIVEYFKTYTAKKKGA